MNTPEYPKFGKYLGISIFLLLPQGIFTYFILSFTCDHVLPQYKENFNPLVFFISFLFYVIIVAIDVLKDYIKDMQSYYDNKFEEHLKIITENCKKDLQIRK